MHKILFILQKRNDAIWIVDFSVKKELKNIKHNFVFFELKEKWENKIEVILNYLINIFLLLIKVFWFKKVYFSWENPYVIFVKFFYPWKKIFMCVHHVEDYWWKSFVWKLILKSVYKFITISNFTKKQLIWIWASEKDIFVNYNWINKDFFQEKIKNFLGFPYILYVWTELERKNLKNLFDSFKLVLEKYENIKLIKIWLSFDKIEEKKNNDYIKKLKIEKNVIFIRKNLSHIELRKYYSNAICYVSVSKLEWFWLTIPEALACGCPVVVSNIEPFQEILWTSQIIVNLNDIHEISKWILIYIEDKYFREKMIKEWMQITKKFNWVENVNILIKFLN